MGLFLTSPIPETLLPEFKLTNVKGVVPPPMLLTCNTPLLLAKQFICANTFSVAEKEGILITVIEALALQPLIGLVTVNEYSPALLQLAVDSVDTPNTLLDH